jgi:S-adenosylmethionine uptake transporter
MMALPSTLTGAGLGLLAFGAYAGYDVSAKFLGGAYHPLQIIAAAGLMTMPLLLIYALLDKGSGSLRPVRPGLMALRSVGTILNFVTGVTAFTLLPLAEAYVIFFTMPLFISLLAIPVLGERFGPIRGAAVVLGLVGVVIALDPTATELSLGHALALSGSLIGAMNYVIIRKTGAVERTAVMLIWPQLALFLVVACAMPFVYVPMPVEHIGVSALMAVVLMVGMLAIIAAYRRAPAVVVAPMQYSQIAWAAIFGALLFGEEMTGRTMIGMVLIAVAGLIVVARQERPKVVAVLPEKTAS